MNIAVAVIVLMVVALVSSEEKLAMRSGSTTDDESSLFKRTYKTPYFAQLLQDWLSDRAYNESCIKDHNVCPKSNIKQEDCSSICTKLIQTQKFDGLMTSFLPCLNTTICRIDLANITLSKTRKPIFLNNYQGSCDIVGSAPMVTNANNLTQKNNGKNHNVSSYAVHVIANIKMSGFNIDCKPNKNANQQGSNSDAFSGPIFISQNINFTLTIMSEDNDNTTDYGTTRSAVTVSFSNPEQPNTTAIIPQKYQPEVQKVVSALMKDGTVMFWMALYSSMYANMFQYYVYANCPKCK